MSFGDGMIWDDFWSFGWCGRSLILDDFDMNTEHNDLWTYYSDGSILLQVSGSAPQQWLDAEKKVAAATVPMSCICGWTVFWKGNVDLVKHPDGPGYAYAMGSEGGSRHLFSIPCFGEREVLFLSFQTFRCNCLRSSSFVPSQNVLGASRLELRRAAYQHWWLHTIPDDIACYIRFCSLIVEVIEHNGTCYLLSCVCTRSGTPHVSTQYLALCYVQKDPQVCITYIGFVGLFVPPELSNLRPSPISFQLWSKWRDLRKLFYRCSVYAISEKQAQRSPKKRAAWLVLVSTNSNSYRNGSNLSQRHKTWTHDAFSLWSKLNHADEKPSLAIHLQFANMIIFSLTANLVDRTVYCGFIVGFTTLPHYYRRLFPEANHFLKPALLLRCSMQCRQREPGQGPQTIYQIDKLDTRMTIQ